MTQKRAFSLKYPDLAKALGLPDNVKVVRVLDGMAMQCAEVAVVVIETDHPPTYYTSGPNLPVSYDLKLVLADIKREDDVLALAASVEYP